MRSISGRSSLSTSDQPPSTIRSFPSISHLSTFTGMKFSFSIFATSSFSKLSRSITWHPAAAHPHQPPIPSPHSRPLSNKKVAAKTHSDTPRTQCSQTAPYSASVRAPASRASTAANAPDSLRARGPVIPVLSASPPRRGEGNIHKDCDCRRRGSSTRARHRRDARAKRTRTRNRREWGEERPYRFRLSWGCAWREASCGGIK